MSIHFQETHVYLSSFELYNVNMIQTLYLQLHHHVAHQAELKLLVAHLPVTVSVAHVEPLLHLDEKFNEEN